MKIQNHDNECLLTRINGFEMALSLSYCREGEWCPLQKTAESIWVSSRDKALRVELFLSESRNGVGYRLSLESDFKTQVRLKVSLKGEKELFHLIPANIFGDNNIEKAQVGEYPILTRRTGEFCSGLWEFRADRASHPVSILCCGRGAAGISIEPYAMDESGELIRNGVLAELPDCFGVSLGYTNHPVTYINKRHLAEPTFHRCRKAETSGTIYAVPGRGRMAAHLIIREIYARFRELPSFKKSYSEAVSGLFDSFLEINYSRDFGNYTNLKCSVPENTELKSWRPLVEIGWTGGGVIAYPLLAAQYIRKLPDGCFGGSKSPLDIFNEIAGCYNEKSGLLYDITKLWNPEWPPSRVNGWWTAFPLTKDCHCAYTNGSGLYYLIKAYEFCRKYMHRTYEPWMDTALKVLDTVIGLQREDGSYGYTYDTESRKVIDWEGFAGCWFTAACAYAYRVTGKIKYLESAERSLSFYAGFVEALSCWGTPMDTWKSVDQEGNLAFIRAARLVHEATGKAEHLKLLERGAEYEYLWKYGFRAKPEFPPLKDSSWNSCGGSVTSVSNPHIHPMGMLVADDLEYLAEQTGDDYHRKREKDTIAFIMNTMELYPDITGYGRYGVLTERFCPSDGLVIEKYSDGAPSSIWFSYNGWAAANTLEAIVTKILKNRS